MKRGSAPLKRPVSSVYNYPRLPRLLHHLTDNFCFGQGLGELIGIAW